MLDATGNPRIVSNYCFEPKNVLEQHLHPLEAALRKSGKLTVYRDAVSKRVEADPERPGHRRRSDSADAEAGRGPREGTTGICRKTSPIGTARPRGDSTSG